MKKKAFKAESKRLLDLMINSIYTHKEIFLREIISNASDAIDKLCYLSLTDDKVGLTRDQFEIKLTVDKENRLLTVSDNGIGMSQEELENNLGVIASSGSFKFRQEVEGDENADTDIIGQFGVGFYSAFMVADEITVITKKYGEEQAWRWQSTGVDGYTIEPCEKAAVGTDIIMHIKPDTEEEKDEYSQYLREYTLQRLVKKYSDYIRFPIRMEVTHSVRKEGCPEDKPEYEDKREWETLNSMIPLWQRKKADVKKEEYDEFYQQRFFDTNPPLSVITVAAEGAVTYKALLFLPEKAPLRYYSEEFEGGLQLYSAGVMIMDKCKDLLPECFNFVRGVVESPDLSLNISRELLQHDRQLKLIGANLEKKVKGELERLLRDDREKYESFWQSFGRQIKLSAMDNYGAKKEMLQDLMLFYSSTEKKLVTLAEYVSRMQEGQKYIYFASGDTVDAVDHIPVSYTHLLPNVVVDHLMANSLLPAGAAWTIGNAMVETGKDPQGVAEAVNSGELDLGKIPAHSDAEIRAAITPVVNATVARINKNVAKRNSYLKEWGDKEGPYLYIIVATGNIYEDITQAKAGAKQGADIIAVIRTTGQSLLDYVPYGATTEGFGGTYACLLYTSGKSVAMKTVALNVLLRQAGFLVCAKKARMPLFHSCLLYTSPPPSRRSWGRRSCLPISRWRPRAADCRGIP